MLAGQPTLMNPSQNKLVTLLFGSILKNHGKITLSKFIEYYNHPSIDKKHLVVTPPTSNNLEVRQPP
jgi:hypothetical protein